MFIAAFKLIATDRGFHVVARQNFLVCQKPINVASIIHDNSRCKNITCRVKNIAIFILYVLEANCAENGGGDNENENWNEKVDDHVLVDRHEAIFLIFECIRCGRIRELDVKIH